MDQVYIQDRFTINQNGHSLSDAIVLPIAQYNALTPAQITQMKQDRFNSWLIVINTPPPVIPINQQLADVDSEIAALTTELSQLSTQQSTLIAQGAILQTPPIQTQQVVSGGK